MTKPDEEYELHIETSSLSSDLSRSSSVSPRRINPFIGAPSDENMEKEKQTSSHSTGDIVEEQASHYVSPEQQALRPLPSAMQDMDLTQFSEDELAHLIDMFTKAEQLEQEEQKQEGRRRAYLALAEDRKSIESHYGALQGKTKTVSSIFD